MKESVSRVEQTIDGAESRKASIEPASITRPFQLLAAWLVALLTLCSTFLIAARTIEKPDWAASLLVIVAVALVPVFLGCMFLLQTKFRPQMQEDQFYMEWIKQQQKTTVLTNRLAERMTSAGLTSEAVALGKSIKSVSAEFRLEIANLADQLRKNVDERKERQPQSSNPDPMIGLELGKALAAEGRWQEAAQQLKAYAAANPSDWKTQFLLGVAYVNSRGNVDTNAQGLRALNEAITFADERVDTNMRARLHAYRGAVLKRLNRLIEAEGDLLLARRLATASYELTDIASNLAGVYALAGEKDKMLSEVRRVKQAPGDLAKTYLDGIRYHLADYFSGFKDDPELKQLLESGS